MAITVDHEARHPGEPVVRYVGGDCIPCAKWRQRSYKRTPEYRERERRRRDTPEYRAYAKAYHREYQRRPETRARDRARSQTPIRRAYQKAYKRGYDPLYDIRHPRWLRRMEADLRKAGLLPA